MSVFLNAAMAAAAVAAVIAHGSNSPMKIVMRYFTVQSNLFCAAASLAVAAARLAGCVPPGLLILKYIGTAAVAVTFLTVMLFLGPVVYNYKVLLTGPDLWLHLVCPLLAIVSYRLWDRPPMTFGTALLGVLPVLLYGGLYLYRVILSPPERRWEDFYGFNRNGAWPVSYAVMVLAAFLVSMALWLL